MDTNRMVIIFCFMTLPDRVGSGWMFRFVNLLPGQKSVSLHDFGRTIGQGYA